MIDARRTLVNLHKEFPNLSLDNLFSILDCYVEMPSQWPSTFEKQNTWPFTKINYGNPTSIATTSYESPQKCD